MSTSPNLGLTLLADNQNGAEILVNQALLILDAIIAGGNLTEATAPPGSPTNGMTRLVIATATGDFAGEEGNVALYWDGTWTFYSIPLPNHWSTTTEVSTGKYRDGAEVFKKVYNFSAGPTAGSAVAVAHGIGTLQLTKPMRVLVSVSNGSLTLYSPSWIDPFTVVGYDIYVDATNISWRATFDMTGFAAKVELEYCK